VTRGLHVEALGDGSTLIVLVNSIGLSVRMWQPQLNALPEDVRLIAYDQPGHGRSVGLEPPGSLDDLADDLMAVLDEEGADTALVCGLSLGGMVGIRAAARYPDRVDRLVLVCTSAIPGDPLKWRDRADLVRAQGMEVFVTRTKRSWFTPEFSESHQQLVHELEADLASVEPESYAACCDIIRGLDLTEDLGRIVAPTLVIGGANDKGFPPRHAEYLRAHIRNASLTVIEDSAHLPNLQHPELFNAALWAFAGVTELR
jgi:3-oxoadipate enol-lactonase